MTNSDTKMINGRLLICGEWVEAQDGRRFDSVSPSTLETLGSVAFAGASDVDFAVQGARRAIEGSWGDVSPRQRGQLLHKLADLVESRMEELATLESQDNGKPIRETMGFDLPQVIETFRYYGGWADKLHGDVNAVGSEYLSMTLKEPAGVVGQIIPWNFPLLMAAWKLGPALATGCTVVLKPAEQTPLSALRLGELILEAGFPAGVVNIVTGDGTTGAALSAHAGLDKIAFTGSTDVGRKVMQAASQNLTRVSLELGGKAPNIVFGDADIDRAVSGSLLGIFFNQGEVCCAGSRLFLHDSIHDEFIEKFQSAAKNLKVGNPLDPSTEMGAQVSEEQYKKVTSFFNAESLGKARVVTGGHGLLEEKGGYFVEPTLIADVENDSRIFKEEVFGPVLCAQRFSDDAQLLTAAHDTEYGLSAGVWTKDLSRAHTFARKLRAGTVWVNCYNVFDAGVPFGGYKNSGFGRELGKQALDLYTGDKAVWIAL